ncbi:uncharacterized protein LOC125370338 [Ricinus communis]|uniref:uncharacterized protein LOC125370338 n=1 Tax=Ricinus communis TaxID=3988 RepID=UPI00201A86B9|nr:uncharacterized protein LOC125370338 [Ricinus communis]
MQASYKRHSVNKEDHVIRLILVNNGERLHSSAWGIDIIKEIKPSLNGHRFIVITINYFSKWVKAESFTTMGARQMARFIERNLICKYGVLYHVMTDNRVQFMGEIADLLAEYKIEYHSSSLYRPQANRAVEAADKNVKKILSKIVWNHKDWSFRLPFAL